MDDELQTYMITAYSEWEALEIEADCRDDQHAIDKARRYGSLRHIKKNFPGVIFSHVVRQAGTKPVTVGTWEYRLKGAKSAQGFIWHDGVWSKRPSPTEIAKLRAWFDTA